MKYYEICSRDLLIFLSLRVRELLILSLIFFEGGEKIQSQLNQK